MKNKNVTLWDKTDIKVFILCLLDEIRHPMTYTAIVDTVVDAGCVGGFDFSESFSELSDDGHILCDTLAGQTYYIIAPSGSQVAAELRNTLSATVREKLHISAVRHLELAKMGAMLQTDVSLQEDGRYLVTCRIRDGVRGEILNLSVTVPDKETADGMKAHSEGVKADGIYRSVMAILTGEFDYYA